MSDSEIANCYPNPSFFQCNSNYVWIDICIGGLLAIPILYFTSQVIRQYIETRESSLRNVVAFFIYASFSFVAIVTNSFLPAETAYLTYSMYVYQTISRSVYCLSHCVLAEQIVIILVLVNVPFAKLLKYVLMLCRYLFILITIAVAVLTFIPLSTDLYFKVAIFSDYINPIISYGYLVLISFFIITTSIAFVFVPRISNLFDKKFIMSMKILLITISFFYFIWYIFFTYQNQVVDFNRIIAIDSGIDAEILSLTMWNCVSEYIPRALFATAMWFLSGTPKSAEEQEIESKSSTISQSLNDEDSHYLFPN